MIKDLSILFAYLSVVSITLSCFMYLYCGVIFFGQRDKQMDFMDKTTDTKEVLNIMYSTAKKLALSSFLFLIISFFPYNLFNNILYLKEVFYITGFVFVVICAFKTVKTIKSLCKFVNLINEWRQ